MSKISILSFHFGSKTQTINNLQIFAMQKKIKLYVIWRTCEALIFGLTVPGVGNTSVDTDEFIRWHIII